MAYDELLAGRVRDAFNEKTGIAEKKMFGGLAFLINGNMCCGVIGDSLMLRLGDEGVAEALREAHTRPMDFSGKPMKSMVYVDRDGLRSDAELASWVARALHFTSSLPAK